MALKFSVDNLKERVYIYIILSIICMARKNLKATILAELST